MTKNAKLVGDLWQILISCQKYTKKSFYVFDTTIKIRFVDTRVSYRQTVIWYKYMSNATHATPLRSVSRLDGRRAMRDVTIPYYHITRDHECLLEIYIVIWKAGLSIQRIPPPPRDQTSLLRIYNKPLKCVLSIQEFRIDKLRVHIPINEMRPKELPETLCQCIWPNCSPRYLSQMK